MLTEKHLLHIELLVAEATLEESLNLKTKST